MSIDALGCLGIRSDKLDDWAACAPGLLGLDLAAWQPVEMHQGASLWGHDRSWLPADQLAQAREFNQLAQAREFRSRGAAEGMREPVQVLPGNHVVNPLD